MGNLSWVMGVVVATIRFYAFIHESLGDGVECGHVAFGITLDRHQVFAFDIPGCLEPVLASPSNLRSARFSDARKQISFDRLIAKRGLDAGKHVVSEEPLAEPVSHAIAVARGVAGMA